MPLTGLLADAHCEGQFSGLMRLMETDYRKLYWDSLSLDVYWLADLGLDRTSSDRVVWETCQRKGLLLVTANRNKEGEDSLESVIADSNGDDCLPIVTIGDLDRLKSDPDYAERAADRLLVYLFDVEMYLGAGRLYVP